MTSASAQIAAENQRRRIPDRWLVRFNDLTDGELADLADNAEIRRPQRDRDDRETTSADLRAWAGWELEYREAFGISVHINGEGKVSRTRR